jgi:hypothetical protein
MNLADPLIAAVQERTGLRHEMATPKVHARLALMPEADRPQAVQRLLHSDPLSPEWLAFAEFCLIHETYFFRHEGQLEFLAKKVVPALLKERLASGRHEFKVWCAACSSGEEAYSAGLLLRDAIQASRETAASAVTPTRKRRKVAADVQTLWDDTEESGTASSSERAPGSSPAARGGGRRRAVASAAARRSPLCTRPATST